MSDNGSLLDIIDEGGINVDTLNKMKEALRSGLPATETRYSSGDKEILDQGSTPLHLIMEKIDLNKDNNERQYEICKEMISTLFEWGAGWLLLDDNNETAGCIALRKGLPRDIYQLFVDAGVRSEVLLRRLTKKEQDEGQDLRQVEKKDTATNNQEFLSSKLEYTDHNLLTVENRDGVMMDWEEEIMKQTAEILVPPESKQQVAIMNIGFGMGIIDSYIQSHNPSKHYIIEPHPDVLAKMKRDGWMDKSNVVVLQGRWQDEMPKLLEQQDVLFDGIYYDTFSEHYSDLLDFIDYSLGLLKPSGILSFFNGFGADRQICYDVYCRVLEIDLADYGLQVEYKSIPTTTKNNENENKSNRWEDIRMQYWNVDEFRLPICKFISL